jgi:hypothetical protein
LFFKTQGDQGNAGFMQLVMQGENNFRFGIIVNEPGPGNVRFAVNDQQGQVPVVDLGGRNYADGQWHYLCARYLPFLGSNGTLVLSIANIDGTVQTAIAAISGAFKGLPAGNDGNLFVGRNVFALNSNSRTFMGLIDEVQLSVGLPALQQRLGPSLPITLTSAAHNENGFTLGWSAQPGETAVIEYTESIDAHSAQWIPIAFRTLSTSAGTYTDNNPERLARPAGFYRVSPK